MGSFKKTVAKVVGRDRVAARGLIVSDNPTGDNIDMEAVYKVSDDNVDVEYVAPKEER